MNGIDPTLNEHPTIVQHLTKVRVDLIAPFLELLTKELFDIPQRIPQNQWEKRGHY